MKLMCAVAAVAPCALFADTYTWTAGGSGDYETLSNWTLLSTGQAPSALPGSGDKVVLPNAAASYGVTNRTTFTIGELVMGGGSDAGHPTFEFANGTTTNEVLGDVTIKSGAVLTHFPNGAVPCTYRLALKVGGDMTVESGGLVDVNGKGYTGKNGPGASNGTVGGAYASLGHGQSGDTRCYGSIRNPSDPGSGNGYADGVNVNAQAGGGVVHLDVAGDLVVNGTIRSRHRAGQGDYGSAASGSIAIRADSVTGSGSISVNNTGGAYRRNGGGGRISIVQRVATSLAFSNIDISGAGGGTLYVENANDIPGRGALTVGTAVNTGGVKETIFSTACTDVTEPFGKVKISSEAKVKLVAGLTLTVCGDFENNGTFTGNGAVVLAPPANGSVKVKGTFDLSSISCASSGASIEFAAGTALNVRSGGSITFDGGEGDPISLSSGTPGSAWNIALGANAVATVRNVSVSDSAATGASISAEDSTDGGGNTGWNFVQTVRPGDTIEWTGAEDGVWLNTQNWNPKRLPVDTDVIVVPSGCGNYPIISVDFTANSLSCASGASICLSGAGLFVTNALSVMGTLRYSGSEKVEWSGPTASFGADSIAADGESDFVISGTLAQCVDFGGASFGKVTVDKTGGSLQVLGGLDVGQLGCTAAQGLAIAFEAGETVSVRDLYLYGYSEENSVPAHLLSLVSTQPGTAWGLSVSKREIVRGVTASDCDATGGAVVHAGGLSTDGGGNVNWDFGTGKAATWTCAGNTTAFSNARNWLGGLVPVAGANVVLLSSQTNTKATVSSALNLSSLEVGDGKTATVTLEFSTMSATNEIANDVIVRSNGIVTHLNKTYPTTSTDENPHRVLMKVEGDMTVESGGAVAADSLTKWRLSNYEFNTAASHGGTGYLASPGVCYGSIFTPTNHGRKGAVGTASFAGGVIILDVAGTLRCDGRISANAHSEYGPYNASGGSVFLKVGTLVGRGTIRANGSLTNGGAGGGGGGRIAVYQRIATGWAGFTGTIAAYGYSAGSVYREDASGERTLAFGPSGSPNGWSMFPAGADGNPRKAYCDVAVVLAANARLAVTNETWARGSRVKIKDLSLAASTARVNLFGSYIRVIDRTHARGKGWAGEYNDVVNEDGGRIVWSGGLTVSIR